ncbi:MAG: FtsW/RodA/SpoVE family cell cycle protein [Candidatus Cloacimonas sp.]|jgi:cell division protein FtsW|nr:FtsW/RodA/SpoVE family cell cycle protein [Candidatus Cloacimonas sp.]
MKRNKIQRYVISFDKVILLCYALLSLIGLVVMLDISSVQSSMINFYRQLLFLIVSATAAIMILYYFDLDKLRVLAPYMVYITILLLIIVLAKGSTIKGATRQINLGPINFQPSFLARVVLVFFFAHILDKRHEELLASTTPMKFVSNFLSLVILTGTVFILIIFERHLSTLIIGGATLFGMLIYAGARIRLLALVAVVGLLGGILILSHGADYRKARLTTYTKYNLFFPQRDSVKTEGGDYQVKESLTALTSGGILGTGMSRGRAKHYYLPEARTDYIFTIIGEEWGFLGALVVFGLHCLLFFRAFRMSNKQENRYLRFLGVGLAMNIFCNVLVNTGVAMSILPPTGNTLPFISYGGSALLIDSASLGVILNISAQRRYV